MLKFVVLIEILSAFSFCLLLFTAAHTNQISSFQSYGGCGEKIQSGGRFNMSGSKKKMFRQTFLDYV